MSDGGDDGEYNGIVLVDISEIYAQQEGFFIGMTPSYVSLYI